MFKDILIGKKVIIESNHIKREGMIVNETKNTIHLLCEKKIIVFLKNNINIIFEKNIISGKGIIKRPEERIKG